LRVLKAKDTSWDAVLMGSVMCTVAANIIQLLGVATLNTKCFTASLALCSTTPELTPPV
jgi:hypothetical protein